MSTRLVLYGVRMLWVMCIGAKIICSVTHIIGCYSSASMV